MRAHRASMAANSSADLREIARRRIPRAIFECTDRGSYDEITIRRNREALEALEFHQRVMVDASTLNFATTLCGQPSSLPLASVPTGLTGQDKCGPVR